MIDDISNGYLWHCRLGHTNKSRMNRLIQERTLKNNDYESLTTCESCPLEKMIKSLFTGKDERANEVLDLVHTDVCRPMCTSIRGGYH